MCNVKFIFFRLFTLKTHKNTCKNFSYKRQKCHEWKYFYTPVIVIPDVFFCGLS